jgi:hypothetical protein
VRDWKSRGRVKPPRGFESHPLRLGSMPSLAEQQLELIGELAALDPPSSSR